MSSKGKQIQSTMSHMEPHQASHDSSNDEQFLHDELEEHQPKSLVAAEASPIGTRKRQCWTVQVRNSEGEVKERPMKVNDIWLLPAGEMVIVSFDGSQLSGTGAYGLLGGFLDQLAQDRKNLPISFRKWPMVPSYYKEFICSTIIKAKLWWDPVHEDAAKAYIMKDIGRKWRENRLRLFDNYYDPTKSRDKNIRNPPLSIPTNEWAIFIDYKLEEGTKSRIKLHIGRSRKQKRRRRTKIEKISEIDSVQQLENEIEELRTELQSRDETIKEMKVELAQLLNNASLPIPPHLVTDLNDIQTPGGYPYSQSGSNQP